MKVSFAPGGPETARRLDLIAAGEDEHPFSAARKATFAASKAVPSKPVYGLAPFTFAFHRAANAFPAGPPAALAAVPRRPVTGEPSFDRTSPFRSASVIRVFFALHWPVRTRDGRNFWKVSGKSMITQPAGVPPASFWASVSKFGCSGFQATLTPTLPPSFFHWATNS